MKNHRGFSLVELIVIIAIMGVTVGLASYSTSMIFSNRVKQCTNSIQSGLSETRTKALSTDKKNAQAYMRIYMNSDKDICLEKGNVSVDPTASPIYTWTATSDEVVGASGITTTIALVGGSGVTVSQTDSVYLTFDRSSGAYEKCIVRSGSSYTNDRDVDSITVSNGLRTSVIRIYAETGKYQLE